MTPEYVQFMTYYMNIELNFVHNANMRLERYSTALKAKNVINVSRIMLLPTIVPQRRRGFG